jgi:hypothetical protein
MVKDQAECSRDWWRVSGMSGAGVEGWQLGGFGDKRVTKGFPRLMAFSFKTGHPGQRRVTTLTKEVGYWGLGTQERAQPW